MRLQTDLIGLAEAEAKIGRLALMMDDRVKNVINAAALAIQTDARKRLTRSKAVDTGRLRSSVRPTFYHAGLAADIGTDVAYAPYIEYGTGPGGEPRGKTYFPPRDALLGWMKRHGIPPEAEFLIRRKLNRKGTPARPFLFPAFEAQKANYLNDLKEALKALERVR